MDETATNAAARDIVPAAVGDHEMTKAPARVGEINRHGRREV